ncbi:MAG: hypothetical protein PHW77_04115 [Eubacteriales bacterium]|nr:hypothetical protein [Eubacteriales bacterium]
MKKAAVAFFLVLALTLSGCSFLLKEASSKTFTKAGLSITLTDAFYESEYITYTAFYSMADVAVFTLKEEFTLLEGFENYSLNEYCQLVISNNGKSSSVQEDDNLTYFVYENIANGKNFSFFCSVYKSGDAFWLVQFTCLNDKYDEYYDDFITWAKSVKFE